MRNKGSVSQVNKARDALILSHYRKAKNLASWPTSIDHLCKMVADMPAPEFYISPETAYFYIRERFYGGKEKVFQNPWKNKLYNALYDRFLELREKPSNRYKSMPNIAIEALATQAPCTGVTPYQVYTIILRNKRRHKKK